MPTADDRPGGARPGRLTWTARAVQVRLRFLMAMAVGFLIIGRWDVLRTYYDRWTAPIARDPAMGAVSADTEYFCPMDPGVLSGWPNKCPVCQMALVRRSKGDMGPLPDGVVARVQLSPDRLMLGGVRSEPVRYRPLAREIRAVGALVDRGSPLTIHAEVGLEDSSWLEAGQAATVAPDPPDGSDPVTGRLRAVEASAGGSSRIAVEVDDDPPALRRSRFARVIFRSSIAAREPFRSMPRGAPPIRPGEPRSTYRCPDHGDVLLTQPGRCPKDDKSLEKSSLATNQRLGWWCPMHPKVASEQPGPSCEACGGMALIPRVVTYCPEGQVLAVPESAVIDTGTRSMVYVESMPGVFDGIEVNLGPRSEGYFPVVRGLEAGQAVATSGAFLVDAETRLNPSLAAGYFGARPSEPASMTPAPRASDDFAGLSESDRTLAIRQAICPVTGKRLGSMGTPVRLEMKGRAVFLCCAGCGVRIQGSPDKYLSKLKPSDPSAHHP